MMSMAKPRDYQNKGADKQNQDFKSNCEDGGAKYPKPRPSDNITKFENNKNEGENCR